MDEPRYVLLCGGATPKKGQQGKRISLSSHGPDRTHRLELDNVHGNFLSAVPPQVADLVDIAAYIYTADARISRGGATGRDFGARWRRRFHFVVPVRDVERWQDPEVEDALARTLGFLSEDTYSFEFVRLAVERPIQAELGIEDAAFLARNYDSVALVSGGIDSFGGAIKEIYEHKRRVLLVNHRSSPKTQASTRRLFSEFSTRVGQQDLHLIGALLDVVDGTTQETTRRSRSFWFAALATAAACVVGVNGFKFYENGIVSLNLPISGQVVGARATRTTHPRFIRYLTGFLARLLERRFVVENEFLWQTRTEVIRGIADDGFGDLLALTNSCASVYNRTTMHSHCGVCSQCIDRAFSARAAGCAEWIPEIDYETHLFDGPRTEVEHRELVNGYVNLAREIHKSDERAFFARFPEATRVADCFDEPAQVIGERVLDLHKRHAQGVCDVIADEVRSRAEDFAQQLIVPNSLLSMIGRDAVGAVAGPSPLAEEFREQELEAPAGPGVTGQRLVLQLGRDRNIVTIAGIGPISGVGGELLTVLVQHHSEVAPPSTTPSAYPFLQSGELQKRLDISDEILRKRIERLRKRIARGLEQAGRANLLIYDFVESSSWHGYRLNPDIVRVEPEEEP